MLDARALLLRAFLRDAAVSWSICVSATNRVSQPREFWPANWETSGGARSVKFWEFVRVWINRKLARSGLPNDAAEGQRLFPGFSSFSRSKLLVFPKIPILPSASQSITLLSPLLTFQSPRNFVSFARANSSCRFDFRRSSGLAKNRSGRAGRQGQKWQNQFNFEPRSMLCWYLRTVLKRRKKNRARVSSYFSAISESPGGLLFRGAHDQRMWFRRRWGETGVVRKNGIRALLWPRIQRDFPALLKTSLIHANLFPDKQWRQFQLGV